MESGNVCGIDVQCAIGSGNRALSGRRKGWRELEGQMADCPLSLPMLLSGEAQAAATSEGWKPVVAPILQAG